MNNEKGTVGQCGIQKVGDIMATIKTSRRSQSNQDDKKFYVSNIKSYSHDKNLYLFKRDL